MSEMGDGGVLREGLPVGRLFFGELTRESSGAYQLGNLMCKYTSYQTI